MGLQAIEICGVREALIFTTGSAKVDLGIGDAANFEFDAELTANDATRLTPAQLQVSYFFHFAFDVRLAVARSPIHTARVLFDGFVAGVTEFENAVLTQVEAAFLVFAKHVIDIAVRVVFFGVAVRVAVCDVIAQEIAAEVRRSAPPTRNPGAREDCDAKDEARHVGESRWHHSESAFGDGHG